MHVHAACDLHIVIFACTMHVRVHITCICIYVRAHTRDMWHVVTYTCTSRSSCFDI